MKITSLLVLISVVAAAAAPVLGLQAAIAIVSIAGLFAIAAADYALALKPIQTVAGSALA